MRDHPPDVRIRSMPASDVPQVVQVSLAADGMFAEAGIVLPDDDPREMLAHVLGAPERFGAVLVAGDPVVGLAALTELDGAAHLEQIAVHPDHGRDGIGTALLESVCDHARESGFRAMTLTSFRDLPWNRPWYVRHGFVDLAPSAWGPQLTAQWSAEEEAGIMVAPRVAMRRELGR